MIEKQTNFGKISTKLPLPDLLDMQKQSFVDFLQLDVPPAKRELKGLQAAFEDVFPIEAPDGSMKLEFLKYELGAPRYATPAEAAVRDSTYSAPLKALLRLQVKQKNGKMKEASEQDVTLCDLPLMTDAGCFVFNGAERVVVSQMHRSPGIIFEEDEEKKQSTFGKRLYVARIIPYRGAWIEFSFDLMNALWVRIDRKKKVLASTFLRACGLETNAQIIQTFYKCEDIEVKPSNIDGVIGRYAADDIYDPATGEVLWNLDEKAALPIDDKLFKTLIEKKVKTIKVISGKPRQDDPGILATLEHRKDSIRTAAEAQAEIYKKMRGQDFVVKEQAETFLNNLIFDNIRRYDLSFVGRYKINKKFANMFDLISKFKFKKFTTPSEKRRTLAPEDIIVTVKYLLALNAGEDAQKMYGDGFTFKVDDIDHLGNRRVRGIGELLENQIRVGLSQMAKTARDRMNRELTNPTPRALVNAQPVQAIVRKFFGTSQLSQFMDQINPLGELTHKRRLSALGPGGLNRKRAGFEVRDVHYTHYGRVCPIETPEGPNIGLITSLACYSKVNKYGLIETPYRKVVNGKVTDQVEELTADAEDDKLVAQANTPTTKDGKIDTDLVACRVRSDYPLVSPKAVDYMDVSPLQVISVSAALIPFLEHDDANRALMGCNMQRQGVPLLMPEAPYVGTGIEHEVARDSGTSVVARRDGRVQFADASKIIVEAKDGTYDVYELLKYKRSNQDTCINQHPIVKTGDNVKARQVIADGPSMDNGYLALGRNMLVGFMCWEGYNYEDAILVSSRLVKDDVFTSIHLHEFTVDARNTKLGAEEITRDIPNIGAEALSHLDNDGIVLPATVVEPGDILVGKVTPKGEQQLTPEERLLKVIFGKKADDVVDASLRVPPGTSGKILGTRVFVRKEKLTKAEEKARLTALENEKDSTLELLKEQRKRALANAKASIKKEADLKKEEARINALYKLMEKKTVEHYEREMEFSKQGDELAVTVNKSVKVYIASKRKLHVGDKMSGRHGNKGVVARILPEEDMPFLPDGTPLDIVLSPLGIPSRMNVGQLLETMLGWAAHYLHYNAATPVFDGPSEAEVVEQVRKAKEKILDDKGLTGKAREEYAAKYLPDDYCRITLYDGRTGEPFEEKVTIGYMYMMKLIHLVEDKVHSRSTGPYSLITRQPLGGKAQFGGQRFGEMEVWAMEGYGATYTLQEFLTVKSDDFVGRTKMYESIVKGEAPAQPGVPESFKVLIKELQALGLSVDLLKKVEDGGQTPSASAEKKAEAKTEAPEETGAAAK
ncbi:DNA-directed RNA polymerase subunit beta [Candidatus Avelusimicrobium gallicola]|uniref:DNA-directed RNA polymerase subunit beta n=1 Tax=Candidatus Avelusimicrobium gallicola TaxID=2562704 RepID=A0A1Y4DKV6_9BACT|nr:DNA-directed RNA polymerase subunit beta [Elusimicrobium sp. An273]OUO56051.1 DNA-directed RNA polymerase subunit beta [Elusimicrobium sp. An273]